MTMWAWTVKRELLIWLALGYIFIDLTELLV